MLPFLQKEEQKTYLMSRSEAITSLAALEIPNRWEDGEFIQLNMFNDAGELFALYISTKQHEMLKQFIRDMFKLDSPPVPISAFTPTLPEVPCTASTSATSSRSTIFTFGAPSRRPV